MDPVRSSVPPVARIVPAPDTVPVMVPTPRTVPLLTTRPPVATSLDAEPFSFKIPPAIVSAGVIVKVPVEPICNVLVAASSAIAVLAVAVPVIARLAFAPTTSVGPLLIVFAIVRVPPLAMMEPAPDIVPPVILP